MTDQTTREHVYWHELRSPIGTLITLLDVASQSFEGQAPAELLDLLLRAKRQADRLGEMVAAAHDMERLRWGALKVRKEPLDLTAALQAAFSSVEPAAKTRGVRLDAAAAAPLALTGDPVLVGRCLESLLRASVEASQRCGTVAVELRLQDDRAVVKAELDKPVSAEGLRVAFTQESALGIRGGSALGLYEVKLLVEAMGGSVASAGQCLELRLPG